jgi:hypothetical protein
MPQEAVAISNRMPTGGCGDYVAASNCCGAEIVNVGIWLIVAVADGYMLTVVILHTLLPWGNGVGNGSPWVSNVAVGMSVVVVSG